MVAERPPLPALTGLRFVLACVVLLHHMVNNRATSEWIRMVTVPTGGSMVPIFFALSGFVLTYHYTGQRMILSAFLRARAARLLPAFAVSLLIITVAARHQLPDHAATWVLSALLLHAWFPDLRVHTWNPPSWSLSCELVFYLLFPLLLPLMGRVKATASLVMAYTITPVLIVLTSTWLGYEGMWIWHPMVGLGPFLIGMALGRGYLEGWRLSWRTGAALVLAWPLTSFLLWEGHLPWALTIAMLAGLVVLVVASYPRLAALTNPTMLLLGNASYALYILHFPLLYTLGTDVRSPLPWWAVPPVAVGVIGLSVAVHLWIEQPTRAWLLGRGWHFHRPGQPSEAG